MFVINEPQKLQQLHESLKESVPESFKVYGTTFHIINNNPFNLEVLVDSWPDYQIVITRPKKEEMKDDLDHYTNTYHIFTKAPDNLEEVLACPQVINWEQAFQIQGCQENLDEVIRKVSASKSVQVNYTRTVLLSIDKPKKLERPNDGKEDLTQMFNISNEGEANRKENFSRIFLDTSHARLVNEQWEFGRNETSLKYVERCLQNFPSFGVLGPEGCPISWAAMEQSCEIRMGYTAPQYRNQGNMWLIYSHITDYLTQEKIPYYFHLAESKEIIIQKLTQFGFQRHPCGWHQWKCNPKK